VGENWVNLEKSVGSDFTVSGASETFDGLELSGMGAVTLLGFVGLLLIAGATAQDGVENLEKEWKYLEVLTF
jgi:hypothetical protein